MRRKYLPVKNFPIYNSALDNYLKQSNILNSDDEVPNVHSLIDDKRNIQYALAEIEGDDNGMYFHQGQHVVALIPQVQKKIDELDKRFQSLKLNKVKQGFKIPLDMPPDWLAEYYTLQARVSAYEAEAEVLEKRLSEWVEEEEKESDSELLKYGLQSYGKLRGGVLETIDGQKVSEVDGIMVISDSRSPYHGMSVVDYRELTKTWIAGKKEANRQKLLRLQTEAREKGERIPTQLPISSPRRVNLFNLPPYPVEYKNYLIEKKIRVRTI